MGYVLHLVSSEDAVHAGNCLPAGFGFGFGFGLGLGLGFELGLLATGEDYMKVLAALPCYQPWPRVGACSWPCISPHPYTSDPSHDSHPIPNPISNLLI